MSSIVRILCVLCLAQLFPQQLFSQTAKGTITGMVTDAKNQPIAYASVMLLASDSLYLSGVNTSAKGTFTLGGVSEGSHIVKISFVGYDDTYIDIGQVDKKTDLGVIVLDEQRNALETATVTGTRVIGKADKQIIMPSAMQVKASVQSFDLLGKVHIPEIIVNTVERTVGASNGGNVQLRINGVRADVNDLASVKAEDVLRIESHNALGARFGDEDAAVIVDVILKEKRTGAFVIADLQNAPLVGFGNDYLSAKLNHKESEFGLAYFLSYRDYKYRHSNRTSTFNFPDGKQVVRQEDGIKTPFGYVLHDVNFSYNLTSPKGYLFNAVFKNQLIDARNNYASLFHYKGNPQRVRMNTTNDVSQYTSSIDLFFKYDLPRNQRISANVVGTYFTSDNLRHYTENDEEQMFVDIRDKVQGNKYSVISELVYEKQFAKINFSTGAKHTQGFADNSLSNAGGVQEENLRNSNTYYFANLQGNLGKLNYSVGGGFNRVYFRDASNGYVFYFVRPSLQASYNMLQNLNVRYSFSVDSRTPSLAELNSITQRVDSFLVVRGNRNLKPYLFYNNQLVFTYSVGRSSANLTLKYLHYDKPIMNFITFEDGFFVNTFKNQKKFQQAGASVGVNTQLIKDVWSVGTAGGVDRFHSQYAAYSHRHTAFWGNVGTNASYRNFEANLFVQLRNSWLWGENITHGDAWQSIDLKYKLKSLKLGVGMAYPFMSAWEVRNKRLSPILQEESRSYIPDNGRMLYFSLSWSASFGKKHQAGQRTLNNTDADTGIRSID